MNYYKGLPDVAKACPRPWYEPRKWYGMNWIKPVRRLGIYLRDGLACVYCDRGVEHGERLTLDHLRPYKRIGQSPRWVQSINASRNLVTACHTCNTSRGGKPLKEFVRDGERLRFILRQARRVPLLDLARSLLRHRRSPKRRVSFGTAMARAAADSSLKVARSDGRSKPTPC